MEVIGRDANHFFSEIILAVRSTHFQNLSYDIDSYKLVHAISSHFKAEVWGYHLLYFLVIMMKTGLKSNHKLAQLEFISICTHTHIHMVVCLSVCVTTTTWVIHLVSSSDGFNVCVSGFICMVQTQLWI